LLQFNSLLCNVIFNLLRSICFFGGTEILISYCFYYDSFFLFLFLFFSINRVLSFFVLM
jgi:hypothetical protein